MTPMTFAPFRLVEMSMNKISIELWGERNFTITPQTFYWRDDEIVWGKWKWRRQMFVFELLTPYLLPHDDGKYFKNFLISLSFKIFTLKPQHLIANNSFSESNVTSLSVDWVKINMWRRHQWFSEILCNWKIGNKREKK